MSDYERRQYERQLRATILAIGAADLSETDARRLVQDALFGLLGLIAEQRAGNA